MQNEWVQSGNSFFIREVSQNVEKLKPVVYKLEQNPHTGELYLSQVYEQFDFPYKIYGIETKFINRVLKTYDNTKGNLGLLLNGVKGTGKTVTAKQLCNKLGLPTIIIHHRYDGIPNFINEIQQDVTIFVDEFEKIYPDRDHSVLTIMDGAMDNGYRKVFLLTTNSLYVNENMIQRPGRIRYLKTYEDLSLSVIMEIVDDKLVHKQWREQTIEFISQLETITVDIVKAVIDEVNIHNEDPKDFKDVFNIKLMDDKYDVIEAIPGEKDVKYIASSARIFPAKFNDECVGMDFEADGRDLGEITNVVDENTIVCEYYDHLKETTTVRHYKVEKVRSSHGSFYGYNW